MGNKQQDYKDYIESNIDDYQDYQRKALAQEPEMTKWLKKLMPSWLDTNKHHSLLDVGCGNGNTCFHLNTVFPHWQYLGIDVVPGLIEDGQRLFSNLDNLRLEVCDAHQLSEQLSETFDIVLIWRVLQGLTDWQLALRSAFELTKPGGNLIVSTLLNDADVDIQVAMYDHTASGDVKNVPLRIFSQAQFINYCQTLDVASVQIEKFSMPITLPRPDKGLNTYTVDLENGSKTQFAGGALVDHWKMVRLSKNL